jgi:hypothetical protein
VDERNLEHGPAESGNESKLRVTKRRGVRYPRMSERERAKAFARVGLVGGWREGWREG